MQDSIFSSAKLPCTMWEGTMDDEIMILVLNEATYEPMEDGIEGEIWISSPSNAEGGLYYPSLTREVFHGRLRR